MKKNKKSAEYTWKVFIDNVLFDNSFPLSLFFCIVKCMNIRFWFILWLFILAGCTSSPSPDSHIESGVTASGVYRASLDPDERIVLAKKRKSYMSGIRKWDFYSLRNAPEEALTYYLAVEEKLPNDQVVRKKIAHVYFLLKNWTRAYEKYIGIPIWELPQSGQDELFQSLFFDESLFDRIGELSRIPMSTGSLDYYRTIDTCYSGIHNCIVSIVSSSGSDERLADLRAQVMNSEKITSDFQYRNFLVAVKFYEQKMYRASEKIAREILIERPDYIEVTKLLGFSLFELGKYEEAKKYLLQYLEKNPKDIESIIHMGNIHFSLGNYVSSNLYLNNAILSWYKEKSNLERQLAYNYSLLGDTVGMMKVLNYLLQESDVTEDDYAIAISAALNEWEDTRAESWARNGMEKYKKSSILTPLYITTLRTLGDIDNAYMLIQNTSEKDMVENPNYLLEKWILLLEKGDIPGAREVFSSLIKIEGWPDITSEANSYLARIGNIQTSSSTGAVWW